MKGMLLSTLLLLGLVLAAAWAGSAMAGSDSDTVRVSINLKGLGKGVVTDAGGLDPRILTRQWVRDKMRKATTETKEDPQAQEEMYRYTASVDSLRSVYEEEHGPLFEAPFNHGLFVLWCILEHQEKVLHRGKQ